MSVAPLTVRLCTGEDVAALTAREVHGSAQVAARNFQRQSEGTLLLAVVLDGEQLLGSCALDLEPGNYRPELKSLWVYPEFRRRGAGRALTRFLEERAAELGFVEVFLRVDPDNVAAIPLYISLDYSPTGDHVLTSYESFSSQGQRHTHDQVDAVYRKSLLAR